MQLVHLGQGIAGRVQPGKGESILWIHGYTMDSSTWAELWSLLPGWNHIGIDLPGHGASRPLEPGEDLSTLAHRLTEVASAYGARHLVALSFGTIVALQMAIDRPYAFSTLVLGAPALTGAPYDTDVESRYEHLIRLYLKQGPGPHLGALWMTSPPNIFKGVEANPHLWDRLAEVIKRHGWSELGSGAMYTLTRQPQTAGDLAKIEAATLVLMGEHELPAYKYCAQLINQAVRVCELVFIPEAGHLCMLEAPDATSVVIGTHLQTCRSSTG